MELLYGNQRKILKFLYKIHKQNKSTTIKKLEDKFRLANHQVFNLCNNLHKLGYIRYVSLDYNPVITAKGIDYFSAENGDWLSKNIIAILALAVSILAFIRTL